MIHSRLDLADIGSPVERLDPRSCAIGGSSIRAFSSHHLLLSSLSSHLADLVWIGEDEDPLSSDAARPSSLRQYRTHLDCEGIVVAMRRDGRPAIEVARTAAGTCPIYVCADRGVLTLSWRFDEVAAALGERRPNVAACRLFLEHGHCQVRDMVIEGIYMLWPGEALTFDSTGLSFHEVEDLEIVVPSGINDDARVTDEFVRIIEEVLRPRLSRSQSTLLELSGGLDSAYVALAASNVGGQLSSYGVIHDGAMGRQQRKRREEAIARFGLEDHTHPSAEPSPFGSLDDDISSLTPFDDLYRMACVAAVENHPGQDFDLLLTGMGGDELTMEETYFRRDWEVKGHSSLSSITGAAVRADMFMRLGIWVFNPLAHPRVVNFCRALPDRLREHRMLHLLTLARAGLSDGFLFPRFQEHCGNLIQHDAARFDFEQAMDGAVIPDYGIADHRDLLKRSYEAGYGGFPYPLIMELFRYLKLDRVLRRYITA